MKIKFIKTVIAILFLGLVSNIFTQKIDFSVYLASMENVHTSNVTVVDKQGNIFVAGGTRHGLKVTDDAFQKKYHGHSGFTGGDTYLMKLSPEGELIYSTYIGGSGNDAYCSQITLDDSDNVYVAFTTASKDLPVSENAYQRTNKGQNDHYIIKFSNDCKYICSTYFGGIGSDHWSRVAVHNNVLYLIGKTRLKGFPTTKGVIQEKFNDWKPKEKVASYMISDISITTLSLDLDKVIYSTLLGGKSFECVNSFSFDANGNIILTGSTYSDDYPTTKNAYDRSLNGKSDGYLTIIKPDLSEIIYSTFIGGSSGETINSIVSHDSNHIILTGHTDSKDFPVTKDALNGTYMGGKKDGFITKFNINSNKLEYSSFLGGSGDDDIRYGAKTDKQKYVLVGVTKSKDIPVTKDAIDNSFNGVRDLVLMILDKNLKKIDYATYIGGTKNDGWAATGNYIKNNQLLIMTDTGSIDFPFTKKIAGFPSDHMNTLLKINLNYK